MSLEAIAAERLRSQGSHREIAMWLHGGHTPEERLLSFDRWVRAEIDSTLRLPVDPKRRAKSVGQCAEQLQSMVMQLWKRGWFLDGRHLATHIQAALVDVAKAQAAGRVEDFWPFFCSVVNRYVGLNAEELHTEAMSAGAHISQALGALGRIKPAPTIPELVAQRRDETLREKLAKARRLQARRTAAATQFPLL